MVTKNEAFPSKYVKAADLPEPVVGTIKVAELEQIKGFDGKPQNKVVVYFARGLKPLPLNRVNWESVADICGSDDSDDFPGTKIELYATTTSMNGKTMDCVRVRAPGGPRRSQKKPKLFPRRRTTMPSRSSTTKCQSLCETFPCSRTR